MWDFFHFANLARKGWIKFKGGHLEITGLRILMMDVDTLNGLEVELENVFSYKSSGQFIYKISKQGGRRACRAHHKFSKYAGNDLVDYMETMATGAGWGIIKIDKIVDDAWTFTVENSPFVKRKKGIPTCHFLRGFLAGSGTYITGHPYDCIETECKSAGAKYCRFVAMPSHKIRKMKSLKSFLYQIEEIGPTNEFSR